MPGGLNLPCTEVHPPRAPTHATAASLRLCLSQGPHLDVQVVALLVLVGQLVNQLRGPEGHGGGRGGSGIFFRYLIDIGAGRERDLHSGFDRYWLVKNVRSFQLSCRLNQEQRVSYTSRSGHPPPHLQSASLASPSMMEPALGPPPPHLQNASLASPSIGSALGRTAKHC